ncbi:hypothetical protein Nepgr_014552 [Nepenthes gracilis]|uniref:Uncharacterized protein n=1 Tax=Nepenthes gracilis TaxID=150966 RepID=A0AAD3SLD3_NEPGR|nr:hypothetical protein Nepgr_014552 [Nepenthes gracilis]
MRARAIEETMSFLLRFCYCLWVLWAFAVVSAAREARLLTGGEETAGAAARSLGATLDDYGDPSANTGHDPGSEDGGGSRRR